MKTTGSIATRLTRRGVFIAAAAGSHGSVARRMAMLGLPAHEAGQHKADR